MDAHAQCGRGALFAPLQLILSMNGVCHLASCGHAQGHCQRVRTCLQPNGAAQRQRYPLSSVLQHRNGRAFDGAGCTSKFWSKQCSLCYAKRSGLLEFDRNWPATSAILQPSDRCAIFSLDKKSEQVDEEKHSPPKAGLMCLASAVFAAHLIHAHRAIDIRRSAETAHTRHSLGSYPGTAAAASVLAPLLSASSSGYCPRPLLPIPLQTPTVHSSAGRQAGSSDSRRAGAAGRHVARAGGRRAQLCLTRRAARAV